MTRAVYLLWAFAVLAFADASGQEQRPMSMSIGELFKLVDANNTDIGVAQRSVDAAVQGEKVARSAWLPQVNASLSLSYLGDGTILDRDFGNPIRDRLPHFSNTLNVEVYQPVYTGGAISAGIDVAEKQSDLAGIALDAERNAVRMSLVRNYLELSKNRNLLAVYDENIALTEKLLDDMRVKRDQGVVLKNDITRYELRLSSLGYDRLATENAVRICNSNIVSLLGLSDSLEIIPEIPKHESVTPSVGEDEWLMSARSSSSELNVVRIQKELELARKRVTRAEYLPKIGVVAGDNFLGPVTFEVPVLDKNYNSWFVGVNIKWNISSLFTTNKATRKHDMEISRIQTDAQAAEESVERRIHEAYILYCQSLDRLEIERKNVQLAEENYSVVSNRFDNQLALLTDMLDASNARLDAGVRLVNAEISAQFYYYQLHFIAGTLIRL